MPGDRHLKEAPWAVNPGLFEADAVCHFRRVRICIRTCRSCIERVANEARHYREYSITRRVRAASQAPGPGEMSNVT